MGVNTYKDLRTHVGHKIVCVGYKKGTNPKEKPWNVAVECETCHVVLMDFDARQPKPRKEGAGT
jgi:hypothetical protein